MSKAEKLRADFGVQVYAIIHKGGKYWEYSSVKDTAWPPARDTLVSTEKVHTPRVLPNRSIQATFYPVPTTITPDDFKDSKESPSTLSVGTEPERETEQIQ
jgi:hypothetical protein